MNRHSDQLPASRQPSGEIEIVAARFEISRRVVVIQQHSGCPVEQREAKQHGRIDRSLGAGAEGNLVIGTNDRRPTEPQGRVVLRPNRYDPNRANLAVFNWAKKPTIELPLETFLATGDTYRLVDPRDFFGEPISEGTYEGGPIRVAIEGEFAAFVLLKASSRP